MPKRSLPALISFTLLVGLSGESSALDFGGVGVGPQVLVQDADEGGEAGVGFGIRTRFLWILGLEFSATQLDGTDVVTATPFRVGLLIHLVQSEYVHLYLSPGMAGQTVGDAFNPVGSGTWYRAGGGLEIAVWQGLRLGAEVHWAMPGRDVLERYVEDNAEQIVANYIAANGATNAPTTTSDVLDMYSTRELLDMLPLDRLEFTVGLRYYF